MGRHLSFWGGGGGGGGEPEMTIRMANPSRSGGHSAVLDTPGMVLQLHGYLGWF